MAENSKIEWTDHTFNPWFGYAKRLAEGIWKRCYRDSAPQWKPPDDLLGVLTQIDNMVSGMARTSEAGEVAIVREGDAR